MPYKATGNPPGRPRKDAADEPEVDEIEAKRQKLGFHIEPGLGGLCGECFPDGWQPGWTGVGCRHGSWTRLATGIVS